jgi:hypothetical protein
MYVYIYIYIYTHTHTLSLPVQCTFREAVGWGMPGPCWSLARPPLEFEVNCTPILEPSRKQSINVSFTSLF